MAQANESNSPRPMSVVLLEAAILLQGISGLGGGASLIFDPTGAFLQIPLEWLAGSPFDSYLVPGVILFLVLGVYPVFVWYGVRQQKSWSWLASLSVGVGLIIWIAVEIVIIGYHSEPPLQLIYGFLGVVILALILVPSSKRHLQGGDAA